MSLRTKKTLAAAVAATLGLGATLALAQPGPRRELPRRARSLPSAHSTMREMLQRFDTNKDGKLDEAERAKAHETMSAEHFKEMDTDKNGSLSLAEFQAGMKARMGKMGKMMKNHGGPDGCPCADEK